MGVTPGRWIGIGWSVFKADAGNFVLMTVITLGLMSIGTFIVAGPLMAGLFFAVRRKMTEGRTEFGDLFQGFNYFIDALLVFLVASLFKMFGLALCILPVFVVAALYLFPYLFVIDRRLPFWEAMEASRRLVSANLAGYVGFLILLLLLNLLGVMLAGVGLLVTIPVTVAAITAAYQERVGFVQRPVTPPGPIVIP